MFDDVIRFTHPVVDTSHAALDGIDELDRWIAMNLYSDTRRDDAKLSKIAACRAIYAAYNQVQREQQWHIKAHDAAKEREAKLRGALIALMESLGGDNGFTECSAAAGGGVAAAIVRVDDETDAKETEGAYLSQRGSQRRSETAGPVEAGRQAPAAGACAEADRWQSAQAGSHDFAVYLLRPFSVFVDDRPICDLANRRSKAVLKYLLLNRQRPVAREVLWSTFWPDAAQEAARNNLNVAIWALRKGLASGGTAISHIISQSGGYRINDELSVWVDSEAFDQHFERGLGFERSGDFGAAAIQYRTAAAIYQCDLLDEDRYEDWLVPVRQRYRDRHIDLLRRLGRLYFNDGNYASCIEIANRLVHFEPCEEESHRLMMRCHARMGHTHLAFRQFHICVAALTEQLNVAPSVQTVELFRQIKMQQSV